LIKAKLRFSWRERRKRAPAQNETRRRSVMIKLELWRDRNSPRSVLETWDAMARDFDSFFGEFERAAGVSRALGRERVMAPACDIHEDAKGYVLSLDLPGFKKEDINVELTGQTLVVSGRRQREMQGEGARPRRVERQYGEFLRTFALPEEVRGEGVEASYEDGVLSLSLPKSEAAKPKRIEIGEAKGGSFRRIAGFGKGDEEKDKKVAVSG
jgi:HSP20 family protein